MLVNLDDCMDILQCPKTGAKLRWEGDHLISSADDGAEPHVYPILEGIPILIDFESSVLSEKETVEGIASSPIKRARYGTLAKLIKRLLSPAKRATRLNVSKLVDLLRKRCSPARVLVVGGGTVGQGMDALYANGDISIYSFDIYASDWVQLIADAHKIPFAEDTFDAVVIQAVLEHVLQPNTVVNEIWRVLKPDGLVYAETPFMQQVHEGAYDFTRFSESGHRYLFRQFEMISSGPNGGPGIQFMWSVDYLVRGLFRSRAAGKAAKFLVFWAQYLDGLIPERYAIDGASGVYFLGQKSPSPMKARQIVSYYKGAW